VITIISKVVQHHGDPVGALEGVAILIAVFICVSVAA